jgi:flotillin
MASKEREAELQIQVETKRKEQNLEAIRATNLSDAIVQAEAQERLADANLYSKHKEAEGLLSIYNAQAEGIKMVCDAGTKDPNLAKFYLGLNADLYPQLASKVADAVQGLNPKIHIWNTGPKSENNVASPILDLLKGFGPVLDGISDDVQLPSWMPSKKVDENIE